MTNPYIIQFYQAYLDMISEQPLHNISRLHNQQTPQNTHSEPIYYFLDVGIFGNDDSLIFNHYQNFIDSTLNDLGEDWRVESNLLEKDIEAIYSQEDSNNRQNVNIFIQFLVSYVKDKVSNERDLVDVDGSRIQEKFSEEVIKNFGNNSEITASLTFETLSLGFGIKATDKWKKIFSNIPNKNTKDVMLQPLVTIKLPQRPKSRVMSNQITQQSKMIQKTEHESQEMKESATKLQQLLQGSQLRDVVHTLKSKKPKKNMIMGEYVGTINQFVINGDKIRVISLENQFYKFGFISWLIFKSLDFDQYLSYFQKIYKGWRDKLKQPLWKFYSLIQKQYNYLSKDYSMTLSDSMEFVEKLVERVKRKISKNWEDAGHNIKTYADSL